MLPQTKMFSVVTYSVPRFLLPFVQPSSLWTSSTHLYLQGHSSLSLYPLHHSLPLHFAMGIFRHFCTFSRGFSHLEVAFFEYTCRCIALLHFLISFPAFCSCLSASHTLTLQALGLSDFIWQLGKHPAGLCLCCWVPWNSAASIHALCKTAFCSSCSLV